MSNTTTDAIVLQSIIVRGWDSECVISLAARPGQSMQSGFEVSKGGRRCTEQN